MDMSAEEGHDFLVRIAPMTDAALREEMDRIAARYRPNRLWEVIHYHRQMPLLVFAGLVLAVLYLQVYVFLDPLSISALFSALAIAGVAYWLLGCFQKAPVVWMKQMNPYIVVVQATALSPDLTALHTTYPCHTFEWLVLRRQNDPEGPPIAVLQKLVVRLPDGTMLVRGEYPHVYGEEL